MIFQKTVTGDAPPKVFITQEHPRHDFSAAEKHGEIHFLTANELSKQFSANRNSLMNDRIIDDIKTGLGNFDFKIDSILLSGNPLTIGIALSLAFKSAQKAKVETLNVLCWDGHMRDYKKYFIAVEGL